MQQSARVPDPLDSNTNTWRTPLSPRSRDGISEESQRNHALRAARARVEDIQEAVGRAKTELVQYIHDVQEEGNTLKREIWLLCERVREMLDRRRTSLQMQMDSVQSSAMANCRRLQEQLENCMEDLLEGSGHLFKIAESKSWKLDMEDYLARMESPVNAVLEDANKAAYQDTPGNYRLIYGNFASFVESIDLRSSVTRQCACPSMPELSLNTEGCKVARGAQPMTHIHVRCPCGGTCPSCTQQHQKPGCACKPAPQSFLQACPTCRNALPENIVQLGQGGEVVICAVPSPPGRCSSSGKKPREASANKKNGGEERQAEKKDEKKESGSSPSPSPSPAAQNETSNACDSGGADLSTAIAAHVQALMQDIKDAGAGPAAVAVGVAKQPYEVTPLPHPCYGCGVAMDLGASDQQAGTPRQKKYLEYPSGRGTAVHGANCSNVSMSHCCHCIPGPPSLRREQPQDGHTVDFPPVLPQEQCRSCKVPPYYKIDHMASCSQSECCTDLSDQRDTNPSKTASLSAERRKTMEPQADGHFEACSAAPKQNSTTRLPTKRPEETFQKCPQTEQQHPKYAETQSGDDIKDSTPIQRAETTTEPRKRPMKTFLKPPERDQQYPSLRPPVESKSQPKDGAGEASVCRGTLNASTQSLKPTTTKDKEANDKKTGNPTKLRRESSSGGPGLPRASGNSTRVLAASQDSARTQGLASTTTQANKIGDRTTENQKNPKDEASDESQDPHTHRQSPNISTSHRESVRAERRIATITEDHKRDQERIENHTKKKNEPPKNGPTLLTPCASCKSANASASCQENVSSRCLKPAVTADSEISRRITDNQSHLKSESSNEGQSSQPPRKPGQSSCISASRQASMQPRCLQSTKAKYYEITGKMAENQTERISLLSNDGQVLQALPISSKGAFVYPSHQGEKQTQAADQSPKKLMKIQLMSSKKPQLVARERPHCGCLHPGRAGGTRQSGTTGRKVDQPACHEELHQQETSKKKESLEQASPTYNSMVHEDENRGQEKMFMERPASRSRITDLETGTDCEHDAPTSSAVSRFTSDDTVDLDDSDHAWKSDSVSKSLKSPRIRGRTYVRKENEIVKKKETVECTSYSEQLETSCVEKSPSTNAHSTRTNEDRAHQTSLPSGKVSKRASKELKERKSKGNKGIDSQEKEVGVSDESHTIRRDTSEISVEDTSKTCIYQLSRSSQRASPTPSGQRYPGDHRANDGPLTSGSRAEESTNQLTSPSAMRSRVSSSGSSCCAKSSSRRSRGPEKDSVKSSERSAKSPLRPCAFSDRGDVALEVQSASKRSAHKLRERKFSSSPLDSEVSGHSHSEKAVSSSQRQKTTPKVRVSDHDCNDLRSPCSSRILLSYKSREYLPLRQPPRTTRRPDGQQIMKHGRTFMESSRHFVQNLDSRQSSSDTTTGDKRLRSVCLASGLSSIPGRSNNDLPRVEDTSVDSPPPGSRARLPQPRHTQLDLAAQSSRASLAHYSCCAKQQSCRCFSSERPCPLKRIPEEETISRGLYADSPQPTRCECTSTSRLSSNKSLSETECSDCGCSARHLPLPSTHTTSLPLSRWLPPRNASELAGLGRGTPCSRPRVPGRKSCCVWGSDVSTNGSSPSTASCSLSTRGLFRHHCSPDTDSLDGARLRSPCDDSEYASETDGESVFEVDGTPVCADSSECTSRCCTCETYSSEPT